MNDKPIEAEVVPTQAVAVREQVGQVGILRPAGSLDQIAEAFKEYQRVCEKILNADDYQAYEGKPRKKKSAWRKLATAFNVSTKKVSEDIVRDPSGHVLSAQFTMQAFTPSRIWEAVGYCEINEKCCSAAKGQDCRKKTWKGHYCCQSGCDGRKHWSHPDHDVISTAQTRATNRAISDLIGCGEVSAEELTDDVQNVDTVNAPSKPVQASKPQSAVSTPPASKPKPAKIPASPQQCREKFVKNLEEGQLREKATQFLIDLAWLLPTEKLEDLAPRFVPQSKEQYVNFLAKLTAWSVSGKPEKPYEPNPEGEPEKKPWDKGKKPVEVPREEVPIEQDADAASEPWYKVIVPIPHKGEKRDEYLKHPDTIGSLYEARHDDEEARKRLWGFLNHFEPKGWTKRDGTEMPPSDGDKKFRQALDQFGDWFENNHPEEEP